MASVFSTQVGSSPQVCPVTQMFDSLESAAEQLMVLKDFDSAYQTCTSGLERLSHMDEEDTRTSELKAGFCIVGIQALAEMNQWPGVLSWVLQYYENPESIPARILQMCIVLYSKVGEAVVMQEDTRAWLHWEPNQRVLGFGTVAELYLLHVLVPLGHMDQARQLILGEVGSVAFSEEQRLAALEAVKEKEDQNREPSPSPDAGADPDAPLLSQGSFIRKLEVLLKLTYRKLLLSRSGSVLVYRLVLAAVLLYMLLLRLDPALPSSFLWISKLLQLLRQLWNSATSMYSSALTKIL